ncbi:MAG: isoamylase early set domain-containing protein [Pseudomonadota bacterium]
MAAVTSEPRTRLKKLTFSVEAAGAREVILVGDFNNWDPGKHLMKKDKNGVWIRAVSLPPGQYEYKFLIDGEWKEDPLNPQSCSNCFGTLNSVVDLSS